MQCMTHVSDVWSGFFLLNFCQVTQVSLDSLVSLVYQEPRVILDSRASDSQDPQVLKVKKLQSNSSLSSSLLDLYILPEYISCLLRVFFLYLTLFSFPFPQDSQVSPDSQDLLVDQADQELTDFPGSLEYLDPR